MMDYKAVLPARSVVEVSRDRNLIGRNSLVRELEITTCKPEFSTVRLLHL